MQFKASKSNVRDYSNLLKSLDGPVHPLSNKGIPLKKFKPSTVHDLSKYNSQVKKSILKYVEKKELAERHPSTMYQIVYSIITFWEIVGDKPPEDINQADYKKWKAAVVERKHTHTVQRNKWNCHIKPYLKSIDSPKIMTWINDVIIKAGHEKKKIISKTQMKAMSSAAYNLRDSFYIEGGFESSLRINEFTGIKINNLTFHEDHCTARVKGSKGKREDDYFEIAFIESFPSLVAWMQSHPHADNKEAYLLCNHRGDQISQQAINQMLERAAKRANIPFRVSSHHLRHSGITHSLLQGYSTEMLKTKLNYAEGSNVLSSTYSHIKTGDVINRQLQLSGIKPIEENIEKHVSCPKCSMPNDPVSNYCIRCSEPMTESMRKMVQENKRDEIAVLREELEEMRIEFLRGGLPQNRIERKQLYTRSKKHYGR